MEGFGESDAENHFVKRLLCGALLGGVLLSAGLLGGCKACPSKVKRQAPAVVWRTLLDGHTHAGWGSADNVAGLGELRFEKPGMVFDFGDPLTIAVYTNALPTVDYEVEIVGRKVEGADFFCGFTFPVSTNHCSLILGGWGGFVTGISSLDGLDASENETAS